MMFENIEEKKIDELYALKKDVMNTPRFSSKEFLLLKNSALNTPKEVIRKSFVNFIWQKHIQTF